MSDDRVDVGDVVRLSAAFANAQGSTVVPSTCLLTVKLPNGLASSFTPSGSSTQVYADILVDHPGDWQARFVATSAVQGAVQTSFTARAINTD